MSKLIATSAINGAYKIIERAENMVQIRNLSFLIQDIFYLSYTA
jgi:hypothetical protein